jgi:hypothetical protein
MSRFTAASVHPHRILSGAIPVAPVDRAGNAFTFDPHILGNPVFEFPRFFFRGDGSISFDYVTIITDPNLPSTQNYLPAVLGDVTISKVPFARCGVAECAVSAGISINCGMARDRSAFLITRTASR